jgi:hypothetical protein
MLSGPTQNLQKTLFYRLVIAGLKQPYLHGKIQVTWKEGGSTEG